MAGSDHVLIIGRLTGADDITNTTEIRRRHLEWVKNERARVQI